MGLWVLVSGSILGTLGTLGGLGAHRWVEGYEFACDGPVRKTPLGYALTCGTVPSPTPFVAVGVAAGVLVAGLWTWRLLRPSTRG